MKASADDFQNNSFVGNETPELTTLIEETLHVDEDSSITMRGEATRSSFEIRAINHKNGLQVIIDLSQKDDNSKSSGELRAKVCRSLSLEGSYRMYIKQKQTDSAQFEFFHEIFRREELGRGESVFVWSLKDNFQPKCSLRSLSERFSSYNNPKALKINMLSEAFHGWRQIRGDGNCYYRAVYLSLLEQLAVKRDADGCSCSTFSNDYVDVNRTSLTRKANFQRLFELFEPIRFSAVDHNRLHEKLLSSLIEASDSKKWMSVEELEADLLNPDTGLDLGFVRACRSLTAKYLVENKDEKINGLNISEAILLLNPHLSSVEEYCEEYVLMVGEDAEGMLIDANILTNALNCRCYLCYLDRGETADDLVFQSPKDTPFETIKPFYQTYRYIELEPAVGSSSSHKEPRQLEANILGVIYLLLQPGHYDMLYAKSEQTVLDLIADLSKHRKYQSFELECSQSSPDDREDLLNLNSSSNIIQKTQTPSEVADWSCFCAFKSDF